MVPDAIDPAKVRRILVTKLRHHGDVLLTSPVFSVLRNHLPAAEIDALVYRDTAEMLSYHPAITALHTIDKQWKNQGFGEQLRAEWDLLSTLRNRRYDLIVHLTEHPRGAWLTRLCQPRYAVIGNKTGLSRFVRRSFTHLYPLPRPGNVRHTVEINLDALRRLGIYPSEDERDLTLVPGPEAEASITTLLEAHGLSSAPFIHVHPASRWHFKMWSPEKMGAVLRTLHARGHRIVLTAAPSPDESRAVREILHHANCEMLDLSGRLSLKQLAALTRRARCFVGVDSAPMHIAASQGTPVVALFGPSSEKQWGPWRTRNRVIVSDHSCRPCGFDGCGGGKISECLTSLPEQRVLDAVEELLQPT